MVVEAKAVVVVVVVVATSIKIKYKIIIKYFPITGKQNCHMTLAR